MTLLIIAVILNRKYKRNLLLTLVVGFSGLMPMQMVTDYYVWWAICLGFETSKIFLACYLKVRASYPVMFLCGLMLGCHIALIFVDNLIPHTVIIPILEHLEIVSCVLFSHDILQYLKRKIACLWK